MANTAMVRMFAYCLITHLISMAYIFGALAGPPLAGVIQTTSGGFKDVSFYSGGVIMIACMLLIITRRLALGKWTGKF